MSIKRFFKQNSHNALFKGLAGFGRSLNRLYENRNHDIYSNGEVTVLKKIAKLKPVVIVDGGANVGHYTLAIQRFNPDAKIYAFEPVEDTFQQLVARTKPHDHIIPIQKGLYDKNCTQEINLFTSHTHSSIYDIQGISYQPTDKRTITLVRGDDFMTEQEIAVIDFLKIDIEGAEYDALVGFKNAIKMGNIKAIQFEYGYINITTKKLLLDFYHFFEENGYVLGKIFPKIVEFRKYEFKYEDFIGPNFIAVKKSETKLIDLLSKK